MKVIFFLSTIIFFISTQEIEKTDNIIYKTIHISINGSDQNSGSFEKPLKSLQAAQEKVRNIRKKTKKGNIEVIISEGEYFLDKTLHFNLEDSSAEGSYVIFKAAEGKKVIISGGKKIKNWKKVKNNIEHLPHVAKGKIWVAELDWLTPKNRFHTLILKNKFLPRSRSGAIESKTSKKKNYLGEIKYRESFKYRVKGNKRIFRNWKNIDDIEIYTKPSRLWLVNYLPIKKVNIENKKVCLNTKATYTITGYPLFVENAIDFLDSPGEWCVNTVTKKLYYWPKGDSPEDDIIIPYLNEVVRVEGIGDSSLENKEKPVRGLIFEGLTFSHADRQRWEKDDIGIQHDWAMWNKANGLIRFVNAKDCRITKCKFLNSGSDGVRADLYAQNIKIDHSYFKNLGGVGILFDGYGPGLKDVNHDNLIEHNTITKVGQIFLHSPAVFVWQSGNNIIRNNHIYELAYVGMVFSGVRRRFFHRLFPGKNPFKNWPLPAGGRELLPTIRWEEIKLEHGIESWESYDKYMHTRNNKIEYNEIHDCMKKLYDGNAIYMSAHGKGNEINYNVIYNHKKNGSIRTDDDSQGCTIKGNLIFGTISTLGIKVKGHNKTYNNFLINSYITTGFSGNAAAPNAEFKKNVIYQTKKIRGGFHSKLKMVKGKFIDKNTYFHIDKSFFQKKKRIHKKKDYISQDRNSIFIDPQFVNMEEGDFSLKKTSPSLKLGTQSLPKDFLKMVGPEDDPFFNRFSKNPNYFIR